ncbi:MAG: exosome complex exonuclease Rrp41 [Methanosarcinales archaeon]|nr:exosome complex exonuclease Rrp41 [ANME-2 cluster archaeon]MDW7775389.1 exosome complex exonuclease Rrp41 [Methanosarcinales archaeon]
MSDKPEKFIDENGLRLDGRKLDQIRDIKIEVGVLARADGSCYLEFGKNKVIAAVYGPREVHPRHQQESTRAIVRYKYNMASFSVEDRKRPGPDRRSTEVSKVSREALEDQVFTEYFPKSAIDIFVEVLQADAGTRTAALNAASVALADAGIPMRGLVSACAFGKVDNTLVLDLNKDEDNYGQADVPIAMTPDGKITLLQMDGHLTPEELKTGLKMAQEGCRQVYEKQRQALRDHFAKMQGTIEKETEAPSVEEVVKTNENVPSEDVNTAPENLDDMVAEDSDIDKMDVEEDISEEAEESLEELDILEDDSYE